MRAASASVNGGVGASSAAAASIARFPGNAALPATHGRGGAGGQNQARMRLGATPDHSALLGKSQCVSYLTLLNTHLTTNRPSKGAGRREMSRGTRDRDDVGSSTRPPCC